VHYETVSRGFHAALSYRVAAVSTNSRISCLDVRGAVGKGLEGRT
jgi:hypothetical protein